MIDTLFNTHIPIVVIAAFVVGLLLIGLEVSINAKGVLAVIGGLCFVAGIILCGITGTPTIEIAFLLVLSSIIIMLTLSNVESKQILLNRPNKLEQVVHQVDVATMPEQQSSNSTGEEITDTINQNIKDEVK